MRSQLVIIGIVIFFVSVGLCGCIQEQPPSSYKDSGLEIVTYNVATYWSTGSVIDKTLTHHKQPGFYHNVPEDANPYDTYYLVNFTVKNNAGKLINAMIIKVVLCDINDNELYTSDEWVSNLPNSYSKDLSVKFLKHSTPYFEYAEKVRFSFVLS